MENPRAFEVRGFADAVQGCDQFVFVRVEGAANLFAMPDIETPLGPFGVRIERGKERTFGCLHLPQ